MWSTGAAVLPTAVQLAQAAAEAVVASGAERESRERSRNLLKFAAHGDSCESSLPRAEPRRAIKRILQNIKSCIICVLTPVWPGAPFI